MYYNKFPYGANFSFISAPKPDPAKSAVGFDLPNSLGVPEPAEFSIRSYPGNIFHVTVRSGRWPVNHSRLVPDFDVPGQAEVSDAGTGGRSRPHCMELAADLGLIVRDPEGKPILESVPGGSFGVNGSGSLWKFRRRPDDRFYGMGEKWFGRFELSGIRTKFWNTDAWSDFSMFECIEGVPDPVYAAIPYLIVRRSDTFIGILVNNPEAVIINTGSVSGVGAESACGGDDNLTFDIGSESGPLDLVIIIGPTMRELTCRLQQIVGTALMPPAWALGYHQCRWGYRSAGDLRWLNAALDENAIPCDGIWIDIDYMDNYRVFTFNSENFPDPEADIAEAQASGRRVVPIIDPGVKKDPGYNVFDDGAVRNAFCRNPQGGLYVGLVWPGETVFPDFSAQEGRDWWAAQVEKFAGFGFHGVWIDMNDPSTGISHNSDMLFGPDRLPHETYHNQYAAGMAQATRAGLERAHKDERIFILSRSASPGISRYSAVWTGDNYSNYHHLAASIPTTLNLALSGVPFNGPDIGGFGGDAAEQLLIDWIKAGFLFPFLRNHSCESSLRQEPWVRGPKVLKVMREYIQLRYRLRPYLYNLFIRQAERGEAVMAPVIYHFPDDRRFDTVNDEFMIGSQILQAPFITENDKHREVLLPEGRWYEARTGRWTEQSSVRIKRETAATPLYFREGAVIPWSTLPAGDNSWNGAEVEFMVFISGKETAGPEQVSYEYVYSWDDGITRGFERGERSTVSVKVIRRSEAEVHCEVSYLDDGYGKLTPRFALPGSWPGITVTVGGREMDCRIIKGVRRIAGRNHKVTGVLAAT